ncbi:MAG TPA: nucleoside deaminase [Thermoanaerobaculia bacterium]|nr:nucleoside deaminase [Thermoanaerobaculia bacterium]
MHETYMRRCLALAEDSLQIGETPVGSLIVRGDRILGEGLEGTRTLLDPSAHAEVQAIRAACRSEQTLDLSRSTLYTTVEPCVLCAYAIRRAKISTVVYGLPAGQAGGITSRYDILADRDLAGWAPPPEIVAGVLAEECREILTRRNSRPERVLATA